MYRKVWIETFKALQSQDCVTEMKIRVEDELEDAGERR